MGDLVHHPDQLLLKVDVRPFKVDELALPEAGLQEGVDDRVVTGGDGLQENLDLICGKKFKCLGFRSPDLAYQFYRVFRDDLKLDHLIEHGLDHGYLQVDGPLADRFQPGCLVFFDRAGGHLGEFLISGDSKKGAEGQFIAPKTGRGFVGFRELEIFPDEA